MRPFKKVKNIHFVGIGGAGMIGIAKVLLQKGYRISGSDISDSNDLQRLRKDGAQVYIGHSTKNIKGANLLVVSSAINKNNPELIQAKKDSITTIPRAEMLGSLMIGYESIAVAGSHGKTTTTSLIASIFEKAKLDPTIINGGVIKSLENSARLGKSKWSILGIGRVVIKSMHIFFTNITNIWAIFFINLLFVFGHCLVCQLLC